MKVINNLILLVLLFLVIETYSEVQTCEVQLSYGTLRGTIEEGVVKRYARVPYARPPTGTRRLKNPEAWVDDYPKNESQVRVYDATEFGPACMQGPLVPIPNDFMDEDCLYMSIYTPLKITKNAPVLVYFTVGGTYNEGGNNQSIPQLLNGVKMLQNIPDAVLVTVQIRLGPLGWLFVEQGNEVVRNVGYRDSLAALQWIQKNIEHFGGNKSLVTILGEGDGANVVAMHLFSTEPGYYQRVIMQSTTLGAFGSFKNMAQARELTNEFLKKTKCDTGDKFACLRKLDKKEFIGFDTNDKYFAAVIDVDTFANIPTELAKKGAFNKVPILLGHLTTEYTICNETLEISKFNETLNFNLNINIEPYSNASEFQKIMNLVTKKFSSAMCTNPTQCCSLLNDIMNDFIIKCPTRRLAKSLRTTTTQPNIYYYNFDQVPTCPPSLSSTNYYDIPYVFGSEGSSYLSKSLPDCTWTKEERDFSRAVSNLWYQFALTGNPTENNYWFSYDRPNYYYLNLAVNRTFIGQRVRPDDYCNFWDEVDKIFLTDFFSDILPKNTTDKKDGAVIRAEGDLIMIYGWIFFIIVGMFFLIGCIISVLCMTVMNACSKNDKRANDDDSPLLED